MNRIQGDTLVPARALGKGRYSEAFLEAVDWALSLHPEDRPRCVVDLQKALGGQLHRERAVTVPTAPAPQTPTPRVAAPALAEPRAESGFSFPWAMAATPLLALGVVIALFSGLGAVPPVATAAAQPRETPAPAKVAVAAPIVEKRAPAAKALIEPTMEAVAQMDGLSSFQDCPGCPAMTVLPKGAGKAFAIGRFEVTAAQYQECVGTGACRKPLVAVAAGNLPIVNVSWTDAQAYAAWLSRKSGRRYRLPSEAEWEYAARSGTSTDRFWGADSKLRSSCQYANATDSAACRDGHAALAAVGSFKPNWFDLHDTAGNVWEFTADCYSPGCAQRAVRGGSWRTPAQALRSTSRSQVASAHRSDTLGLRVVAD